MEYGWDYGKEENVLRGGGGEHGGIDTGKQNDSSQCMKESTRYGSPDWLRD